MSGFKFCFEFPLPPDELRVNRRMGQHWGNQHRAKKDYQEDCGIEALAHEKAIAWRSAWMLERCHLVAVAYLGARQRCDPSDLGSWCKVPLDVLVAQGILASDSAACVRSFTAIVERDARNPRLEITLKGE